MGKRIREGDIGEEEKERGETITICSQFIGFLY